MKKATFIAAAGAIALTGTTMAVNVGHSYTGNYSTILSSSGPSQLEMFNNHTGSSLVANDWTASGLDFTSASLGLQAIRVQDKGGSQKFHLDGSNSGLSEIGNRDDNVWRDGFVSAMAEAKFAGFDQSFGTRQAFGPQGGQTNLFDTQGEEYDVIGSGAYEANPVSPNFTWMRSNDSAQTVNAWSSDRNDNGSGSDGEADDFMITYRVFDAAGNNPAWNEGRAVYVFFWEDLRDENGLSDWDYNDLMVIVQVIPLPPAALLGLAGLVGAGVLRRRMG